MVNEEKRFEEIAELLRSVHTMAVVGIKDQPHEDAFRVPQYMQQAGYRILPVNPKLETVLGETCCSTLLELETAVDLVDIFRASEHIPGHVEEILAMSPHPKVVWMQLGIHHGPSAQRLREAGIEVVQDRCIMVDHRRLIAGDQ